jgi:uncharacterized protein YjbJ (UPF0337 family)
MKPIHWILGGMALGAAVAVILLSEPDLQHETRSGNIEDAANQAWRWGTKKRFGGAADRLVGRAKESIGRVTGDDNLVGEGVINQAAGAVKDTAGRWGHAVGETIHDLNR